MKTIDVVVLIPEEQALFDAISLVAGIGVTRDRVKYTKDQVRAGQMVEFGK